MTVTVVARGETFARLLLTGLAGEDDPEKVELAADWRSHEPVILEIGPVLHPDDAVANKMAALYGRALARDFLDVYAILASGRYTRTAIGTRGRRGPWFRTGDVRQRHRSHHPDHRCGVRRIRHIREGYPHVAPPLRILENPLAHPVTERW